MNYDEFITKYGEIMVKFQSYYKYSFTFIPVKDCDVKSISVVGTDNIYRFEVVADKEYSIIDLEPSCAYLKDDKYLNFDW